MDNEALARANGYGSYSDWYNADMFGAARASVNSAFTEQGQTPYYQDTTTPVSLFGGYTPTATGLEAPTGPVNYITDMINPQYRAGLDPATNPSNGGNGQAVFDASYTPGMQWNPSGGGNSGGGTPQLPGGGRVGGYGMDFGQGGQGGNPYLEGVSDDIQRRSQFALGQAFNGIKSNAIGVGGLGGSRQGVAEGIATGMANDSLTGNLANLWGNSWNSDQNREIQRYGMDQNFYTAQRGQDQTGAALGGTLYGLGSQAPWTGINNANGVYGNYTGFGNNTTSQQSGGGWQGAIGGAIAGAQMGRNAGWW
jgi:hypothetical protein